MTRSQAPSVALVSMPWMLASMPSIQLATLAATLREDGIDSDSHELFVDFAARVGLNLYAILSGGGGFVEEWIFARHYYGRECGNALQDFRAHRPRIGLQSPEVEDQVLDALAPVTDEFLDEMAELIDWSRYDIVAFSITISQTAASMALARLLKLKFPGLRIVCGGASCAGTMGAALLRACRYFDVVVSIEGELVLPELVRRLRSGAPLDGIPGTSWRRSDGGIATDASRPIHQPQRDRPALRYDSYFERLDRLDIRSKLSVWLPFESTRGCWYGEKTQCTFCGLHEIMEYRGWPWTSVLAELEFWAERYQTRNFFAVDLIMPRSNLTDLLPEVIRRGHDWTLFYEVKANMKRSEVELLSRAGVRWIQPGLESLDTASLKLMRKGVTALQNVRLLKWCAELGIRVTWNIIVGIPGEDPSSYAAMATLIRRLFHLTPPSGASAFELQRFSPMFEQPGQFGIESLGAHPLYKHVFPLPSDLLDDMVYRHSYRVDRPTASIEDRHILDQAIADWTAARMRGAELSIEALSDGLLRVRDSRCVPERALVLERSEALLYAVLDAGVSETSLTERFSMLHPEAAAELDRRGGVAETLRQWDDLGLVMREAGRVLSLATRVETRVAAPSDGRIAPNVDAAEARSITHA